MKEHRIYINDKLVNICINDFVLMNNLTNYHNQYGKDNVTVKYFEKAVMDEEKEEWLKNL